MIILLLILGITILVIAVIYELRRTKPRREFRALVEATGIEGRWQQILTHAHDTFPAAEGRKLESAMRARSQANEPHEPGASGNCH